MRTVYGTEIITEFAYTYSDYTIMPSLQQDIELKIISTQTCLAKNLCLNIPIVGANMGHLGGRMAEKLAQLGGIGILSQDFQLEETLKRIRRVKQANPYFHMPVVLNPENLVADAVALMSKRHFDCVIVVDAHFSPVGFVTQKDLAKFPGWEQLSHVMKKNLLIVPDTTSTEEASGIMIKNQIHHLPVINSQNRLVGCLTPLDITLRLHNFKPALDEKGRLLIGAAIGMKAKDTIAAVDLAKLYIREGVDVLILDVANGYLSSFVQFVRDIRKEIGQDFPIIAGNVADYEGTVKLLEAGCDTVKVGIGPGGACTTRRETGVGVPQATAVEESLRACRDLGNRLGKRGILADGGITNYFDFTIAILLGAPAVMVGSLFAGTYESAFETEIIDGEMWKRWRGNASSSAATYRRKEIYGEKYITEELEHSEGADGMVKVTGSVAYKIFNLVEGLKHYMAQSNCKDIASWQEKKDAVMRLKFPIQGKYSHPSQLVFESLYIKPQSSEVLSRKLVRLETSLTSSLSLNIPYIALPASFVQKKICTILAQLGGMGFLSKKKPNEDFNQILQRVQKIKSHHPFYFLPSIQEQNEEIGKAIDFLNENAFSCVIIVKDFHNDWTPIGIATRDDLYDRPRTDPLYEVVKTNIYKVNEGIDLRDASDIMLNRGIHHLPVVNHKGHLVGCITPRDVTLRVLYKLYPNIDKDGRLRVGASLNVNQSTESQILEEATALSKAGVDALLLDTDNGYSYSYIQLLGKVKEKVDCVLVGAGVTTYDGVTALFQSGADVVKTGSRIMRIPHLEMIQECAKAAIACGKSIFTEDFGNINEPRDVNLSLILGANAVGIRDILAPTYENSIQSIAKAIQTQTSIQQRKERTPKLIKKIVGNVEYIMEDLEPFSTVDIQPLPVQGSVISVIARLLNGLRSSCTYSNSGTLAEYQKKAILGVQTPSGYWEGKPHAFLRPGESISISQ